MKVERLVVALMLSDTPFEVKGDLCAIRLRTYLVDIFLCSRSHSVKSNMGEKPHCHAISEIQIGVT